MNKIAMIIPSRGRPQNIAKVLQSFQETNTLFIDLFVVADDDDPQLPEYQDLNLQNLMIFPRMGKGMAKKLNKAACLLKDKYLFLGFMGDDHYPRTVSWDIRFIEKLQEIKVGLVYGNDLYQKEKLATSVAMTSNIVNALDGMVPPTLEHLYTDDFWMKLGRDIKSLYYFEDVIIEHMHPSIQKSAWDDQYHKINAPQMYADDKYAFENYIASEDYKSLLVKLQDDFLQPIP